MDASRRVWRAAGLAPFVVLLTVSSALAQVSRTFIASYGNDADNCSLTLPCRGFAAALAKTQDKGEVVVLDSAGYGPATISQSVSIVAPASVYAGITVSSGVGIAINGSHPRVVLRNVVINGLGGGRGVEVQQPAEVHVYDCEISNLATGIEVTAAGAGSTLYVRGAVVRGSGTAVHVGGKSTFQIEGSRLLENGSGVLVDGGGLGSIRHTVIAGGTVRGVELNSSTALGGIALTIEDSLIADHTFDGVMLKPPCSLDLAIEEVAQERADRGNGTQSSNLVPRGREGRVDDVRRELERKRRDQPVRELEPDATHCYAARVRGEQQASRVDDGLDAADGDDQDGDRLDPHCDVVREDVQQLFHRGGVSV